MDQLTKNRVIGGFVLFFAALLFAPSILTPTENNTDKIDVSINNSSNPNAILQNDVTASKNKPITNLGALPDAFRKAQTQKKTTGRLPPGLSAPVKDDRQKTVSSKRTRGTWIKVGSFANKKNATVLLGKLRKRYRVKLGVANINGKTYHQVLVGPFTDDRKLQRTQRAFTKMGYTLEIQP